MSETHLSAQRETFEYLSPTHPELLRLRQLKNLDVLARKAPGKFPALGIWWWVRGLAGSEGPWAGWWAADILEDIMTNRPVEFICGGRAILYLQSLITMGIQARYVEIGRESNPYSHFACEVWCPDTGVWAFADPLPDSDSPTPNAYTSALDLHKRGLPNFYYFRVLWTQKPSGEDYPDNHNDRFDRWEQAVEWEDSKHILWEDSAIGAEVDGIPKKRLCRRRTSDSSDLYWEPAFQVGQSG